MHYPPETACIMLLARIIATVRQAGDKEGATALFMQFCHRTINEEEEIAHKLLGPEFHNQLETLRSLMEKSLWAPEIQHVSVEQNLAEQATLLPITFVWESRMSPNIVLYCKKN